MSHKFSRGLLVCLTLGWSGCFPWHAAGAEADRYVSHDEAPRLIEAMRSPDPDVRKAAMNALSRVVPVRKDVVLAFVGAMESGDLVTRNTAAHLWTQAGGLKSKVPRSVVLALAEDLRTGDVQARLRAGDALAKIEATAPEAIRSLEAALADADAHVRRKAAASLGAIGPQASGTVPALIPTLKDPVADVREEAARALGLLQVFAGDAVPALIETLKDEQARVRRQAAASLGQIGWPARDASPDLVLGLQDGDASVRAAAAHSLGVIQSRRDRRHSAILDRSLARPQQTITPIAEDAVPALSRALADSSARVRQQAAQALGMFGEAGFFDVVTELIRALRDTDAGVRISAISSLGRIGPKAAKAIQALEHALQDADVTVRTEAAKALKRVKPEAPPRYVGPGA